MLGGDTTKPWKEETKQAVGVIHVKGGALLARRYYCLLVLIPATCYLADIYSSEKGEGGSNVGMKKNVSAVCRSLLRLRLIPGTTN